VVAYATARDDQKPDDSEKEDTRMSDDNEIKAALDARPGGCAPTPHCGGYGRVHGRVRGVARQNRRNRSAARQCVRR